MNVPWGLKIAKQLNLHATITMVKIDHTIRPILTHTAPPYTSLGKHKISEWGDGVVCPPLPTLMSLEEEAK